MKQKINFLTENDCYKARQAMRPTGILVHSTGCEQKRISAYTRQWNRAGVQVCVHGFIGLDDEGELCYEQNLPYDIRCWGAGYGAKGSFNKSHIQFEICESKYDGDWCTETYRAALEVCAKLCREYGIDPENVVTHCEAHAMGYASNHGDVAHWWGLHGLSMDKFREELKDEMFDNEGNYQVFKAFMERYEAEKRAEGCSAYAAEACRRGVESELFTDGDGDGSIDAPQAYVKRQELAAVLDRKGLLEREEGAEDSRVIAE